MDNMDHFSSLHKNANMTNPQEYTTYTTSALPGDDQEESGWTSYFEDFFHDVNYTTNNNGDEYESFSCSSTATASPSMVSDAASFPARKSSHPNHHHHLVSDPSSFGASPPYIPRSLKVKKTRTKEIISHDDSLEDTASSPVNSPKVSDLGAVEINPAGKAGNDHFSISSLGKGRSLVHDCGREEADQKHEMGFRGKIIADHIELKKRGLCLVPLSMLVNYLG